MRYLLLCLFFAPSLSYGNFVSAPDWVEIFGQTFCTASFTMGNKAAEIEMNALLFEKTFLHDKIILESGGGVDGEEMPFSKEKLLALDENPYDSILDENLIYPRKIHFAKSGTAIVNDNYKMTYDLVGCSGVQFILYNRLDDGKKSRFFGTIYRTDNGFEICTGNYENCQDVPHKGQQRERLVFQSK